MISKNAVQEAVNEWLAGKEYFLVDLSVSADDRIVVVIDHAEGVNHILTETMKIMNWKWAAPAWDSRSVC